MDYTFIYGIILDYTFYNLRLYLQVYVKIIVWLWYQKLTDQAVARLTNSSKVYRKIIPLYTV